MVELSEEFAAVEEVRPGRSLFLRKLSIGSDSKKPSLQLIFVHGTCATEKQYQLLLESMDPILAQNGMRLFCVLYDKVGCGRSPAINDWDAYKNSEDMADLEALLQKHVDPSLRTIIVGHSYAPSVFLPLFNEKPIKNIVGCIFMGTGIRSKQFPHRDGGHPIMRLPLPILKCIQKQLTNGFVQMAVHPDHAELMDAVRNDSNSNNMFAAKAYHRHMQWATHGHLAGIRHLPCLVIHGADDGVIPVACGQQLANNLPKSELVIVDRASHLVMIEQPEEVAKSVLAFLRKLT